MSFGPLNDEFLSSTVQLYTICLLFILFSPVWIRICSRNMDPDPQSSRIRIQFRFRIRNTARSAVLILRRSTCAAWPAAVSATTRGGRRSSMSGPNIDQTLSSPGSTLHSRQVQASLPSMYKILIRIRSDSHHFAGSGFDIKNCHSIPVVFQVFFLSIAPTEIK